MKATSPAVRTILFVLAALRTEDNAIARMMTLLKRNVGARCMKMLPALLTVCLALPAAATNSRPELEGVLHDLMTWLPGAYDSAPQLFIESKLGAPPDGEHDRVYRIFAKVEAPQIGDNVVYAEMRAGGKDGPLLQQVVFKVFIDEQNHGVSFDGRRIADPESHVAAHLDPSKQKTLAADPRYGGNCKFYWRRSGDQLRGGFNEGTCAMTSRNTQQRMTWDSDWTLNDHELWIHDNGVYDDGSLVIGRKDRTPLRLYKARDFACQVTVRPPKAPEIKTAIVLHDRGDRQAFPPVVKGGKPFYLDLMNSKWTAADGKSYWDLLRLTAIEGDPTDQKPGRVLGMMWSEPATRRIGLDARDISVRCTHGL